ncbi:MAG: hypothetical protein E5V89_01120 [Mesorhizobium sp.]|nr:MAG: hypothetical protein EOQ28_06535 [Mesorhizobium sp.]TIV73260.1 MAG: hypothetical protein E5V89_01120 [Mesorhizobium sp.]
MMATASGAKGLKTEELVRAYFLRAGFFVMRGIKLRHDGVELTDIDMWAKDERSAYFPSTTSLSSSTVSMGLRCSIW